MHPEPHVRIGRRETEHLVIRAVRREHEGATDYWDGNWIVAKVTVGAGGFRGELVGSLRIEEFVRLRNQLRLPLGDLAGTSKFETMERWLALEIVGDGRGHFHAACVAVDVPTASRLTFGIDFDQTELPEILRGLDAVCDAFPVLGKAEATLLQATVGAVVTIYVGLLDDGVDVWRPLEAEPIGGETFRILSPCPDGERWAFDVEPGQTVRCERRTLSGCACWVIVARLE